MIQNQHDKTSAVLTSQISFVLHKLGKVKVDVLFVWILSHYWIIEDDLVDFATKSTPDISLLILALDNLKNHLRLLIIHYWSEEWTHTAGKLQTNKSDVSDWTAIISKTCTSQALETVFNRLLLEYTKLTNEFIFLRQSPSYCTGCQVSFIVHHVVQKCGIYSRHGIINY